VLVLLLALGCGEPRTTGPTAMVGRVVDASGVPVGGLRMETLETSTVTDPDGNFAIRYKEPDLHVTWTMDRVHWRRVYRDDEDQGRVVEITLPAMAPRRMHCGEDCHYELEWAFGEGLTARLTGLCHDGEEYSLGDVPVALPVARCRGSEEPATLLEYDGGWRLLPPAEELRIEVGSTDEARVPAECEVLVSGRPAAPEGRGAWRGEIYEPSVVTALCDGLPARPARVEPGAGAVRLAWSAHGPQLDLEEVAPWASAVELAAGDGAWRVRIAPDADGVFRLPPLDAGRYTVRVEGQGGPAHTLTVPEAREGVLVLAGEAEQLVGVLHTASDLVDGLVPVDGPVTR